jgi:hypothetical protein
MRNHEIGGVTIGVGVIVAGAGRRVLVEMIITGQLGNTTNMVEVSVTVTEIAVGLRTESGGRTESAGNVGEVAPDHFRDRVQDHNQFQGLFRGKIVRAPSGAASIPLRQHEVRRRITLLANKPRGYHTQ